VTCKHCGATIADKALICYRCGAATTDAKYQPIDIRVNKRRLSVVVVAVAMVVLLFVVLLVIRLMRR
jgi:uncharacterized membrane protein YvbJ